MKLNLKTTLLTTALSASLLGLSAFAVAQSADPTAAAEKPAQHMMQGDKANSHGKKQAEHMARQQQHMAKQQTELKEKLKLTADQEAAWGTFVADIAPEPRHAGKAGEHRENWSKLTTPERLDKMEAHHAKRSEAMSKRIAATRSFYASLSADQQKTFDAQSPRHFHKAGMKSHDGQGKGKSMAHAH